MRRESRFFLKIEHIDELPKDIFIPRVVRIVQRFERPFIAGIEAEFLKNIRNSGLLKAIHPGMSVAIGVETAGGLHHPLLKLDNFITTPHMATHTKEALGRMSLVALDIIRVLEGKEPTYPVNKPKTKR